MRLLLATVATVLLVSGSAHGATVAYTFIPGDLHFSSSDIIDVVGDDADDQITAAIGPTGIDLADDTAPLTVTAAPAGGPPHPCAAVDEHHAHCGIAPTVSLHLDGGAGADRLTATRAPGWTEVYVSLAGGPGDDVLTGSEGTEYLDGGPGRDVVRGLGGDDHLKADALEDGDVIDGGAGTDDLEVKGGGLTADLATGGIVAPGLAVTLTNVEGVSVDADSTALGTDGPDQLGGGRLLDGRGGDDEINGGFGNRQVLRGGEGDDTIYYGRGDDVEAGPGDDVVNVLALGGGAHAINCGPGMDRVRTSGRDVAAADCEWIAGDFFLLRNRVRAAARGPATALRLTASALRPGCGVLTYATQRGLGGPITPVVHVRHPVRPGVPFTVSLPLRPSGRRLLARGQLRAPRVVLRRPLGGCPAHGRWTADWTSGARVRLAPSS